MPEEPSPAVPSPSRELREFIAEAPLERQSIYEFVARAASSLPKGSKVADVGAGAAPFRELFAHVEYKTVDRSQSLHGDSSNFDIVASADDIPLQDKALDAVLCTQVLEHLPNPAETLRELYRLLRAGGKLFLTAPLVWEEHEKPYDFFRYTRSGLEHLLTQAGFMQIEIVGRTDCFTTLAQLLQNARWSLGQAGDTSDQARITAFRRLEEIADELLELAPLDSRRAFPLGYQVIAMRPPRDKQRPAKAPGKKPSQEPDRVPVLYLAPWVDLGGSDKGTIDWFKHIDRERWAPSLITTQPSSNRWITELEPYAEEIWALPDLMAGADFPPFILGFIESREVKLVHIMNSRLGFNLLPDMRCLPEPPAIVVQLHAEEHDRSGYVRYVTSRYGNLVDAFSVTSQQLATAMLDYNIPRSRIHVIYTGVDGLEEFNPGRVSPLKLDGEPGRRILWPGRLVAQKDPLLSLAAIQALQRRGFPVSLHIIGDGDMEEDVIARAREMKLEHMISMHPPSHEMARWYRSSDLLLMTSTFEGVPYVIYEALAMGVPVVAPALPGNVELLGSGGGILIDPRDDIEAYADAIERLLTDENHRRHVGETARERMLEGFSLQEMGRKHDLLYEHLLLNSNLSQKSSTCADEPQDISPPLSPFTPIRFSRDPPPKRSVAVIVPCYQHGRFLPEAIQSLRAQTLPPSRIVIVDDASSDPETIQALDALDQDPYVSVIRMAVNAGPSVARNRALAEITESYVLPLDADDKLSPAALEEMVNQLECAPASVGFIYPNVQHFGNRHDFYEPPVYNLNALLSNNYCCASSLFDRRIFDGGIRYAENIVTGHEDWDLILQMAERDIEGMAAEHATLWYRKLGYSRVNAAEYGPESFKKRVERLHPLLYCDRREEIKATWAPALSLVLVSDCDGSSRAWHDELACDLRSQVCTDFEVIAPGVALDDTALYVRDIPSTGGSLAQEAVENARGKFILLGGASATETFARRTLVEQIIRIFMSNPRLERFVLGVTANGRDLPLTPLTADQAASAHPCAVVWRRSESQPSYAELGTTNTVLEDIIMHWQTWGPIEWRAA